MPERFQLRVIPVKPAEDDELEEESVKIVRLVKNKEPLVRETQTDAVIYCKLQIT